MILPAIGGRIHLIYGKYLQYLGPGVSNLLPRRAQRRLLDRFLLTDQEGDEAMPTERMGHLLY